MQSLFCRAVAAVWLKKWLLLCETAYVKARAFMRQQLAGSLDTPRGRQPIGEILCIPGMIVHSFTAP